MDIKKVFGTNKIAEQEGVWVDVGAGGKLLVARLGNTNFSNSFKRLLQPHQIKLRNRNLPDDIQEKITIEAFAETVLLGWEGLEVDGKKLCIQKQKPFD